MSVAEPSVTRYIRDALEQALFALRDNKLRTALSMLGVAVGVAAVITVGTVAKSGREYVFEELKTYGLKSVWIYGLQDDDNPLRAQTEEPEITNSDLLAVEQSACCPAVRRYTPQVYHAKWEMRVRVGNVFRNIGVNGVGVDYFAINNDEVQYGRAFRDDDMRQRKPVAVIGAKAREELFRFEGNPIGKLIRMEGTPLTVIGVLKQKNQAFLTGLGLETFDVNNQIFLPYTLYQQLLGSKEIHTLQAEARKLESVEDALDQVIGVLERRHNQRFQYSRDSMLQWIEKANEYLGQLQMYGLLAASASLVVGGLSIANIMTTSVIERTREIGIRRAIGARRRDILMQFLLEAVFISAIGSLFGMALAGMAGVAVTVWTQFPVYPSIWIILVSVAVACAVGLLFGFLPARRAASLRPVDALRYE